jgi:hypothetical protein
VGARPHLLRLNPTGSHSAEAIPPSSPAGNVGSAMLPWRDGRASPARAGESGTRKAAPLQNGWGPIRSEIGASFSASKP